jgi:hypothetical protein
MAKKPSKSKIVAALGALLSCGAVITGPMVVAGQPAVPSVDQLQVAAVTDPSDPVGMCRITKACSQ